MKIKKFDLLSLLFIVLAFFLIINRIEQFPLFVDIYYHLSVVRGFDLAGGVVLWDFWEYAPSGRPHLYPPLLHIIMLFLNNCGMSFAALGAFVSLIMFPLSLITNWFSMRKIFGSEAGFFALLTLMSPLCYLTSQSVVNAAALVLVLTPLLFYFFERDLPIAFIATMTACLYTHLSMPHITALAFLLYGIFSKKIRRVAKVLIPSYLLYLPWAYHILLNSEYLVAERIFGRSVEIHLFLLGFALIGVVMALKKRDFYLFPLAYYVAMIPIAYRYPARFSDHSLLPMSMLSGIGISEIVRRLRTKNLAVFVSIPLLLAALMLVDPILAVSIRWLQAPMGEPLHQKGIRIISHDTFITAFIFLERAKRSSEGMFFSDWITPENMKVAELIIKNSEPDEIVFVNNGPFGCFITSFTGRAQTGGMFREVSPEELRMPPKVARIIVLIDARKGSGAIKLWENPPPFLVRVAKVDRVLILRRKGPKSGSISIKKPVISSNLAFALLMSIPACVIVDALVLVRKRKVRVKQKQR